MMKDRRTEYIKKAESLKPQKFTTIIAPVTKMPTSVLKEHDTAVIDFGNHYVGHLRFRISSVGKHQDAPVLIEIKLCEVKKELEEESSNYKGWISKGWIQEEWIHVDVLPAIIELPRRYAFRYVKIEVLAVSRNFSIVIDQMEATTITSADDKNIEVCKGLSKDEKVIDSIAIRTLRNCMQDVFEDGPKRDRRLWIGDLRLQALVNYATFSQNDLVKRCIYLFAGTTNNEGQVRACLFTEPQVEGDDTLMFDYSLFFIPILCDYYHATKDIETVFDLYEVAKKQIELAKKRFDEENIVKDSEDITWCFLDWNLKLNKQTGAQAIYIYCAKALLEIMKSLHKLDSNYVLMEDIESLEKDIELKIQAAKRYLYDEEKGLFVSGSKKQISYAANVWAVLAGILDDRKNCEILHRLMRCEKAEKMVTPYMYHHFVEALCICGEKQIAYDVMMQYWGQMVENGADTFYELFNPENPNESPYGSSIVNSYCHAWSCTPTYLMRKYDLVKEKM